MSKAKSEKSPKPVPPPPPEVAEGQVWVRWTKETVARFEEEGIQPPRVRVYGFVTEEKGRFAIVRKCSSIGWPRFRCGVGKVRVDLLQKHWALERENAD